MNIPEQRHYLYLLIAILLELMVYPFVQTAPYKGMVLNVLSTVVLIAAVFVIGVTKNQRFISLALGGFAFLGIWYIVFIEPRYYLGILSVICRVAFDLYVIALILLNLLRAKEVSANTIFGAVSVYLLLGTLFAIIYALIERLMPGSFFIEPARTLDFVYFSFSTLTTLGYGDITPVAPHARIATSMQAIIGVLYTAILISRFVGIYIAQLLDKRSQK
jgi:hypothetical protein